MRSELGMPSAAHVARLRSDHVDPVPADRRARVCFAPTPEPTPTRHNWAYKAPPSRWPAPPTVSARDIVVVIQLL
jgi:hypothetical protein